MRILCAVDGSEYSRWGVQTLEALADRQPARVILVHVVNPAALLTSTGRNPVAEKRALAVDDSKQSRAAARFLRSRILTESSTVTILTSAENPVSELAERYLSAPQVADLKRPAMDRATALVKGLRNDFIKDGYSVETQVNMDHVIETIVKQVESDHTELLVIGSRGLTKRERLHLGSVSETLLKYTPCSVLIARGVRA